MNFRIGHGYDAHRFVKGRKLILGGVEIPWSVGLDGHSDADVLLHSVMDSFLGALALGDIGGMFPDNDEMYHDANSMNLLLHVWEQVKNVDWALGNLDVTVIAQQPKLKLYIEQMRENIAKICEVPLSCINIKATTEEHMGFTGREEGIASHAVCLLTTK